MVERQIEARGITDARVLDALRAVPREEFVPPEWRECAYHDAPVPIGHGQTVSQPYMVAVMAALAEIRPGDRLLDVGTGSGYAAAVCSLLCAQVYGIELLAELADDARERLSRLGYSNVLVRQGDGWQGWAEHAPYDVILVAAAAPRTPPALLDQLAEGGRLVIPIGPRETQELLLYTRRGTEFDAQAQGPVAFVPLVEAK